MIPAAPNTIYVVVENKNGKAESSRFVVIGWMLSGEIEKGLAYAVPVLTVPPGAVPHGYAAILHPDGDDVTCFYTESTFDTYQRWHDYAVELIAAENRDKPPATDRLQNLDLRKTTPFTPPTPEQEAEAAADDARLEAIAAGEAPEALQEAQETMRRLKESGAIQTATDDQPEGPNSPPPRAPDAVPADRPKRHRRTKAEMEAARAVPDDVSDLI